MIKVKEILFDDKEMLPVYILEDGTKRIPFHVPTGNCWVTSWVTPEYKEQCEKDRKDAEERDLQAVRKL